MIECHEKKTNNNWMKKKTIKRITNISLLKENRNTKKINNNRKYIEYKNMEWNEMKITK